jgi:hypothetical protein
MTTFYTEVLEAFADRDLVTVACGTTCAYLGDERNLREFMVADEVARQLRKVGHTVVSYLIDDSLDPLTYAQLRVAVNKDPEMIARYEHWCGKPIGLLPDPWGCCESYAAHFEEELMSRLHYLDCHPTLIRTAKLYERGVYAPYIRFVLQRSEEIMQFIGEHCGTYTPEKLFWAICPTCGYIDETHLTRISAEEVDCYCSRCDATTALSFENLRGKLNWKLDCAVRWSVFHIDAEPFNKAYLGSESSTHHIAQALSQKFFGGHPVMPLHYGVVKMENKWGLKLMDSLPRSTLRAMLVEHPTADMKLTRDFVLTAASRHDVSPGLTYLDFVKQLLPIWLLTPDALSFEQRELVTHGVAFMKHFMNTEVRLHLPRREYLEGERLEVLQATQHLLNDMTCLRMQAGVTWETFRFLAMEQINALGTQKGPVLRRLRRLVGQEQGLPAPRFLFLLPLDYLRMLVFILELHCDSLVAAADADLVSV